MEEQNQEVYRDPKAIITFPHLRFTTAIKCHNAWCGYVQIDAIIDQHSVVDLGITETFEGKVNELVKFKKEFSFIYFVGYEQYQTVRVTIKDGDDMKISQGYSLCSIDLNISEIIEKHSEFVLRRGEDILGTLYLETRIEHAARPVKLFSKDRLASLGFVKTAPLEEEIRRRREYFHEQLAFYTFRLSCRDIIDIEPHFLKHFDSIAIFVKMCIGDRFGEILTSGKELWRSRHIDKAPFKFKAAGLTFSHEDLVGTTNIHQEISSTSSIVFEVYSHEVRVGEAAKMTLLGRGSVLLKDFLEQNKDTIKGRCKLEPLTDDEDLMFNVKDNKEPSSSKEKAARKGLILRRPSQDQMLTEVPKTPYSPGGYLDSFYSVTPTDHHHKNQINKHGSFLMSGNSLFSSFFSHQNRDSNSDDFEFRKLIKSFGKVEIKIQRMLTLQKVVCGNEFYEVKLSQMYDDIRLHWSKRMYVAFQASVAERKLQSKRAVEWLKLVNEGWKFQPSTLVDMYHATLQNTLSDVHKHDHHSHASRYESQSIETNRQTCRVLDMLISSYSLIRPFAYQQSMKVLAGGWINLPIVRSAGANVKAGLEQLDYHCIRQIGFPGTFEYLTSLSPTITEEIFCRLLDTKTWTLGILGSSMEKQKEVLEDVFHVNEKSVMPVSITDVDVFCTPESVDTSGAIRTWTEKISQSSQYARSKSYQEVVTLYQGFMEASAIFKPSSYLTEMMKRNEYQRNANISSSLNAEDIGKRNESRKLTCYIGTSYDHNIRIHEMDSSRLFYTPSTPTFKHISQKNYDLDTIHQMLECPVEDKRLHLVTWIVGRSLSPMENRKLRVLIGRQLLKGKPASALIIILAAEHRYDLMNHDRNFLKHVAEPFSSLLVTYKEALRRVEVYKARQDKEKQGKKPAADPRKKRYNARQSVYDFIPDASTMKSFFAPASFHESQKDGNKKAMDMDALGISDVDSKVAVIHVVTWSEIMAKAYQFDDEIQSNNGTEANTQPNSFSSSNQLPTISSLKKALLEVFTIEAAERILKQTPEDRILDEHESMDRDEEKMRQELQRKSSKHKSKKISVKKSIKGMLRGDFMMKLIDDENVYDESDSESEEDDEDSDSYSNHKKSKKGSPNSNDNHKEINGFFELNEMKSRFDQEMEYLFQIKMKDQMAKFMIAHVHRNQSVSDDDLLNPNDADL